VNVQGKNFFLTIPGTSGRNYQIGIIIEEKRAGKKSAIALMGVADTSDKKFANQPAKKMFRTVDKMASFPLMCCAFLIFYLRLLDLI
jgi:hypothetical protein